MRPLFFLESLKHIKEVGSFVPSSSILARRMTVRAQVDSAQTIVEIGAGTGSITRQIIKDMPVQSKLLIFEPHLPFFHHLQSLKDPRISLLSDQAQTLPFEMKKQGLFGVDCIISGLPLANLSKNDQQKIIRIIYSALNPGGRYVQFQYSLLSYPLIRSIFRNISLSLVCRNFPPAIIYTSVKN